MKTKYINWSVELTGCPAIIRRCPKCGEKTRYICSERFRINANQSKLDIWLIYRCENCKSTYNHEIYARVNPKSLDREEFLLMQDNDSSVACKYAFDKSVAKRNKADLEYSGVEIAVKGEGVELSESAEIEISSAFEADIKLLSILKGRLLENDLPVSQNRLLTLFDEGKLMLEGYDIRKAKLKTGMRIKSFAAS